MKKFLFLLAYLVFILISNNAYAVDDLLFGYDINNPGSTEWKAFSFDVTLPIAGEKVTLYHIPPGNPDNAKIISVGRAASRAHLAHGDFITPVVPEPISSTLFIAGGATLLFRRFRKK